MNESERMQFIRDTQQDSGPVFSNDRIKPLDEDEEPGPTGDFSIDNPSPEYPKTVEVGAYPPTEEAVLAATLKLRPIPPTEKIFVPNDNRKTDPERAAVSPEVFDSIGVWSKEVLYKMHDDERKKYEAFDRAMLLIAKLETLEHRLAHMNKISSDVPMYEVEHNVEIDEDQHKKETKLLIGDPKAKKEKEKKGDLQRYYEELNSILDDAYEQGVKLAERSKQIHKEVSKAMKKDSNWQNEAVIKIRDTAANNYENAHQALNDFKKYIASRNEQEKIAA